MSPLFIIAFVHCAGAGSCQITDVAPYLRYGNYDACIYTGLCRIICATGLSARSPS